VKILVYGAGVLGSLYAVRLADSENDVTILARSQRLIDIRSNGIVLEDVATRRQTTTHGALQSN
jgi:2-dehydropantoate 2-reductase